MTYIFRQHVPKFTSGIEPVVIFFHTKDELFSHSFFAKYPSDSCFQLSKGTYGDYDSIMYVTDDGYEWWCVGDVTPRGDCLGLDIWKPKYREGTKPKKIESEKKPEIPLERTADLVNDIIDGLERKPISVIPEVTKRIEEPYTLEEIIEKIKSGDYNAEQMMQHLLFHVSKAK